MIKKISKPVHGIKGTVQIPADKSISHRAVMLASIAEGDSVIKNFSRGCDPHSTLSVCKKLGVDAKFTDATTLVIRPPEELTASSADLDCGNSGTTMRLMSGILASRKFKSVLTGDESLSKRTMLRIIEPLNLMGADIRSVDNHAPLTIRGGELFGINYVSSIASAQVKSCILLAGLNADGITSITEPYLSRNHTELMLKYMGADIRNDLLKISVKNSKLQGKEINICGDISSAAYFIAAALIIPDSNIVLKDVGLNPTRTGILEIAKKMGADIEILEEKSVSGELAGDLRIKTSQLQACEISGEIIPRLIDELPVIAVLATQAQGRTIIRGAGDLRNKESDRIRAVVTEFKKLGADIEELEDGFIINGRKELEGGCEVKTYNDHRLAMSLYTAGLICKKEIAIDGFEWTGISFPEFEPLFSAIIS